MTPLAPLALGLLCAAAPWKEAGFGGKTLLLDPRCEPLASDLLGPFVKRGDRAVLAAGPEHAQVSRDDGGTWTARPLFREAGRFRSRGEGALLRTREGTVIFAFLNEREQKLSWDQKKGGPQPDCRLPVYVTRSHDEGDTWEDPQKLQDGWSGAVRQMIQLRSGRVVLACQQAVTDPGRHVSFTYVSDDQGASWTKSSVIDLGEYGGYGDHGGGIEGTVAELSDGRVWMLLRTPRGAFTEAFSGDAGLTWKDVRPSKIAASGSPGLLHRLHMGRLALLWNRYIDPVKQTGRREQLSIAFSEDDGLTWTAPVVLAYDPMQPGDKEPQHRLSYPYVYEHIPGECWVTTMQGPLRVRFREADLIPPRLSEKTYRVRRIAGAGIRPDGALDEPAWDRAAVERGFAFPWRKDPAPPTEFRALCDAGHLYFSFRIEDADVVLAPDFREESDAVLEDRAEIYLARDDAMKDYFCFEIDPRGRAFDYRASYYRRLDRAWRLDGLETAGAATDKGYVVEGRIPLASLEALGFPRLVPGARMRWGLFRAEFSHDRSGRAAPARPSIHNLGRHSAGPPPIEHWISWVDPKTTEPDFHVPASLGWLEVVE